MPRRKIKDKIKNAVSLIIDTSKYDEQTNNFKIVFTEFLKFLKEELIMIDEHKNLVPIYCRDDGIEWEDVYLTFISRVGIHLNKRNASLHKKIALKKFTNVLMSLDEFFNNNISQEALVEYILPSIEDKKVAEERAILNQHVSNLYKSCLYLKTPLRITLNEELKASSKNKKGRPKKCYKESYVVVIDVILQWLYDVSNVHLELISDNQLGTFYGHIVKITRLILQIKNESVPTERKLKQHLSKNYKLLLFK